VMIASSCSAHTGNRPTGRLHTTDDSGTSGHRDPPAAAGLRRTALPSLKPTTSSARVTGPQDSGNAPRSNAGCGGKSGPEWYLAAKAKGTAMTAMATAVVVSARPWHPVVGDGGVRRRCSPYTADRYGTSVDESRRPRPRRVRTPRRAPPSVRAPAANRASRRWSGSDGPLGKDRSDDGRD
jgi:hypothetical protein